MNTPAPSSPPLAAPEPPVNGVSAAEVLHAIREALAAGEEIAFWASRAPIGVFFQRRRLVAGGMLESVGTLELATTELIKDLRAAAEESDSSSGEGGGA